MKKISDFIMRVCGAALSVCLLAGVTVSCVSVKYEALETAAGFSGEREDDLLSLEKMIVEMDSGVLCGAVPSQKEFSKAHEACDKFISGEALPGARLAKVYALKGRLYAAEEKKSKAKSCLSEAQKQFKGEAQETVLANRLGEVSSLDDELKNFSSAQDRALITLEKAISFYQKEDYVNALANFDSAFISLPSFYKDAYKSARDKAWALRGVSGSGSDILKQEKMSVSEMLYFTQETSDALKPYTGGKKYSFAELYKKLSSKGLLSSAKNPSDVLMQDATVNKMYCARFLWNLYSTRKNLNPLMYSEMFSDADESPFPDVKVSSPDFDAALGCVEKEIINLEDGIHFCGEETVPPVEYAEWLKKALK